jgi:hypothetical protein
MDSVVLAMCTCLHCGLCGCPVVGSDSQLMGNGQ